MAFFWQVWSAVAAVNMAVLTVFISLASLQYDAIQTGLMGDRLALLAARTAAPFEQAARIGLGLASVRNADALLERARQTDEAIRAIHVFDPRGHILRSTERSPAEAIPPAALASRAEAGGAPWHLGTRDGFLSGVDIAGRGGASVGGVLVVYSAAQSSSRIGAMIAELILAGIAVLLGAMAFGALLLRLGLRRQIAAFARIETAIEDFEREAWRTAAAAPAGQSATDEMIGMLEGAEQRYREAGRVIAEAGHRAVEAGRA